MSPLNEAALFRVLTSEAPRLLSSSARTFSRPDIVFARNSYVTAVSRRMNLTGKLRIFSSSEAGFVPLPKGFVA
jgi:hypothetical protein